MKSKKQKPQILVVCSKCKTEIFRTVGHFPAGIEIVCSDCSKTIGDLSREISSLREEISVLREAIIEVKNGYSI